MRSSRASQRTATAAAKVARARLPDGEPFTDAMAALDVHRRDKLLEAVAVAARDLLRSSDLNISLPKVAEEIGCATGVDRTHIILVDGGDRSGRFLQHCSWTVAGLATPAQFRNPGSMAEAGLASWTPRLQRGETIVGQASDFDATARAFFELGNVKSVLCVPVFADSQWRGLIGFDDCRGEHDWSAVEIDTIKILAELVGAAIERASHLKSLADASRIIESSPTILYRLAPEPPFALTFVSQNIQHYGYAAQDLLAKPDHWTEMIAPDDLPSLMADINLLSAGKIGHNRIDFRLRKPDGSWVWFDSEGYALRNAAGKLTGIEGVLSDVTDRKRSESTVSFSNLLLNTALESSPDAILIVDAKGQIIKFNKNFIALWDVPRALVLAGADQPVLAVVSSRIKDEQEFLARVRYLYDHPEVQSHEEVELKDGRIIDRHSGSLYDEQRKYLGRVWFFRDITEKKRAAERIATLARSDMLTGLANRAAFLDRLKLECARANRGATQFALHYIDLDRFKDINDTLGHPMGDRLLQAVAKRLKSCLRETDMVARFGGDEFAVLQDDISEASQIEALAVKIGEAVGRPYTLGGNQVTTSASIGIVPSRGDIEGADDMMMKADLALYRAKNEGRNQFRFHVAELDGETRERMVISEDLRHAVQRGELELYYQPQVELDTGKVVGLEGLLRWNHPRRGLLAPAMFIPIAETTGSIGGIGEWVIAQACRQIKAWSESGIEPPIVAVNISGSQFKLAGDIDRIVIDDLTRYQVSPNRLELELTESVLIETVRRHGDMFKRLQQAGVRIAIDDFGTGYSSLDYLRSFRVSRLKIDQRFIENVTKSADDAAIVRATIGLAHALGIEVLAEGVETAAQRDFLIAAGCKFAQGFYFGRPMQVAAAAGFLCSKVPAAVV
jgi:diguanylate cyclase (GGDEF)-like protein/PAS domain S-box-containing protein